MNELRWFLEEATPVRRYSAELLSEAVGLRATVLAQPPTDGHAYLHHGSSGVAAGAVAIPRAAHTAIPLDAKLARTGGRWAISADIVDGTVALVTDAINADLGDSALDRHGRLKSAASALAVRGEAGKAVVNRYAAALEAALPAFGAITREPRWPNGARAAVGLSHDVDRPDKYAILRAAGTLRLPSPRRIPWFLARTLRDLGHRAVDRSPNDFWLFDEVVAAEARHGFKSTFLFSVMPAYGPYGSTNDVLYDAAWPHVRRAMRSLRKENIEIGLHASYNAHRDPARFVSERDRLESLSDGPVRGLRHHFWQTGPDQAATLRAHDAAGFAYDSSIAFNDAVGFRRAIGLPYRPWDATLERPLKTWQLPVIALDSAACATMGSVDEGVERVWGALETAFELGAVAVLDWHVRCSVPLNRRYRAWGAVYQSLLERLAERRDVWTAPLGEVADWAQSRSERIQANL